MKKTLIIASGLFLTVLASPASAADPEALIKKGTCVACHAKDKKLVGPSFKDIAAKYKGKDVNAELADKVRKGSKGVWGPVPMAPVAESRISNDELKEVIKYILSQ